ncbi:MAG: hypothetical protein KY410_03135 [Proteobacteria bacterium]|nr:hypothetical protein [Pseudomonadota bacterium]
MISSRLLIVLSLILIASGCAAQSKHMRIVDTAPVSESEEQATIVFMRPSMYGGMIQASLFEVGNGIDDFIGISSAKTKLAYLVDPGKHRFMVVGESADFLDAEVDAGKSYYAIVSPRMGIGTARFSLYPVRAAGSKFVHGSGEFAKWLQDTDWVTKTDTADQWYGQNRASIEKKYHRYLGDWLQSSPAERKEATLYPEDAIDRIASGSSGRDDQ